MNSFRLARLVARAGPSRSMAHSRRRGYADVAADKIKLSLTLPHQVRFNEVERLQNSLIVLILCGLVCVHG